jgi:hypothetical protein
MADQLRKSRRRSEERKEIALTAQGDRICTERESRFQRWPFSVPRIPGTLPQALDEMLRRWR